jgi:hypothetical protein
LTPPAESEKISIMTGPRGWLALVVTAATLGACSRTFSADAVQPNPLKNPGETLRQSEVITIVRGDMELTSPVPPRAGQRVAVVNPNRWPLYNVASFVVVSRDRLRFHVQMDHKWEEYADLETWTIELEDDTGHKWEPEAVEHARTTLLTTMWDREQRTAVRNRWGDIVALNEDGYRNRQTLGSLSVFRGKADFVFYQRDLFTPSVRSLKLRLSRSGEAFEFRWHFADQVATH